MKGKCRRMLAWLLAVAMVLTGMWVPAGEKQVKAATTVTNATDSSKPVYVEFALDSKNSTSTYNQYGVNIHNNSSSNICDWKVTIQFTSNPGWNAGWNGAEYDSSTKTITIQTYGESSWNNATIYSGEVGSGAGFQVAAGALNNATVTLTYKTGESTEGPATGSGSSGGSSSGGTSFGTDRDYSDGRVTATVANQGSPSNDWSGFDMTLQNNTGSTICDWIVKLQVPSGTVSAFKCWNATFATEGDIIYLYPEQSGANAVVNPGKLSVDVPGGGFAGKYVDASSIKVLKVYYNIGNSSGYDYSSGETNDNSGSSGSGSTVGELEYELTGPKNLSYAETPVGKHGALSLKSVSGYTAPVIVDESGNPFQLRGASTHGMHWFPDFVNESAFHTLRDDWGVNMVRLVCYPKDYNGYTTSSSAAATLDGLIEKGVTAASNLGMYAIVDWHVHQYNPNETIAQAKTFFAKYAQKYANKDNIIYEICNEPTGTPWYNGSGNDLYTYCKEIAGVIRQYDKDALIICGTNTWSQDVDEVANKPLKNDGFTNILYTFHFYSGSHGEDLKNKVRGAAQAGTPLFVTEFGVCDASGNGGYNTDNATDWIKLFDSLGASYACWSFCNKDESASYLKSSCNKTTGGWTASDLTATGFWLINTYRAHEEAEKDKEGGTQPKQTVTGISLNPDTLALVCNDTSKNTGKLTATVTTSDGKAYEGTVTWTTSGSTTATVAGSGTSATITGKKNGTATITAKAGSKSATCKVTVTTKLTGITLSATELSLNKGDTHTLRVTYAPTDASNQKVTWESSDTNVATVNANGVVTAVGNGNAKITVTAEDGKYTAVCAVHVTTQLTGITLSKTELSLNKGATHTLTVTYTPTDAEKPTVNWKSGNSSVATVDDGTVKAIGNGTTTITATTADGKYTATCKVTVTTPLTGIALSEKELSLNKGATKQLSVTFTPTDASNKTVTWSSNNTNVATVNTSGLVTAKGNGTATITATAADGGYTATCTVTVTTKLTGITLSATQLSLSKGNTQKLSVTYTPSDASNKTVTWKTDNNSVATVDNGTVKAIGNGTATITATAEDGGYTATCKVTVTTKLTGIALSETQLSLNKGDTKQLSVTFTPSDASNKTVTWKSDNTNVATVNANGMVTAVKNGTAKVTATAADGGYTVTCTVTVTTKLTGIALSDKQLSLSKGDKQKLTVSYTPSDASNKAVTWKSDNDSVATVDAGGTVTAAGNGTTTITATAEDGGYTATCTVSVTTAVTSVTLDKTTLSLFVNDTAKLTATIAPDDASNALLVWKSTNDSIAAVDDNGNITAKAAGIVTITATAGGKSGSCQVTVSKRERIMPSNATMTLESRTNNSLKVRVDGADNSITKEYRVNNKTWTTSPEFTGLKGSNSHKIEVRYQETTEYKASDVFATGTWYTLADDPYTIDLSRLKDSNYVDSLKEIVNGQEVSTISYDPEEKILTLTQEGKEYTLTGDAKDIKVRVERGVPKVTLDDANFGGLDLQECDSVTVEVKGENSIVSTEEGIPGIQTGSDTDLTLTGEGSLEVTGGAGAAGIGDSGNIVIESGDYTINGGDGAPAIEADEVDFLGGSIDVNAGKGAEDGVAVDADKVVIDNAQVNPNTPKLSPSDPEDTSGKPVTMQKITYKDENGNILNTVNVKKGNRIILPEISPKKGYTVVWNCSGTTYQPKSAVTISRDMTFTIQSIAIKVTSITLKDENENFVQGAVITLDKSLNETLALTAVVSPKDALNTSVIWLSSADGVATVVNGTITPVAVGEAVIMATAADGSNVTAKVTIKVIQSGSKGGNNSTSGNGDIKNKDDDANDKDFGYDENAEYDPEDEYDESEYDNEEDEISVGKPSIKKITAGKKKLTITWKKVKGADGYQVYVSKHKNFKASKKVTVKSGKKTKTLVGKLTSKKKHYVRVRAYVKVDGETIYGNWSKVKSKKVK